MEGYHQQQYGQSVKRYVQTLDLVKTWSMTRRPSVPTDGFTPRVCTGKRYAMAYVPSES